jgi:hypothetical protein
VTGSLDLFPLSALLLPNQSALLGQL